MARYEVDTVEVTGLEKNLYDVADNLGAMAENVNSVAGYVSQVNNKVDDVTKEVTDLNTKMEQFMKRIEGNTVVTNAKQSLMLLNQELDKKYVHYSDVRKHVTGIFQSIDIGVIKKDTLGRVSEEIIIKTPNYWLSRALFALVSWINNNKELANKALDEAINLDDEKTSLLLFLTCLRIKRVKPALVWFNRYLLMQDPLHMDNKIINVINSLTSGVYGLDAKKIFINNVSKWEMELNSKSGIKDEIVKKWNTFIEERKKEIYITDTLFPYLSKSSDWPLIKDILTNAFLINNLYNYFNEIFNSKEEIISDYKMQVDLMIDDLVSNYDVHEGEIQNEILKNNIIVEENGDLDRAYERFEEEKKYSKQYKSFYDYLTDIAETPEKYNVYYSTRKYAIASLKNMIMESINNYKIENNNLDIKINILEWEGITKDGSNEKELRRSLSMFLDSLFHDEVYGYKYVNKKTILGIILILAGFVAAYFVHLAALIVSFIGIVICGMDFYNVYNGREVKLNKIKEIKKNGYIILGNNIAEVVNYLKIIENSKNDYSNLEILLNNLDYNNYIQSKVDNSYRKINVGDNNG